MSSGTAVFRIQGEESQRAFVPEPRAIEMLAAGGLLLALLRAIARGSSR
jgi:hypothetical protein